MPVLKQFFGDLWILNCDYTDFLNEIRMLKRLGSTNFDHIQKVYQQLKKASAISNFASEQVK